MIQSFKEVIQKSWLLKGFLGLLTLSFGIWGVGDFLNPGMDPNIAVTVGKTDIALDQVQRRFGIELDRLKKSLGNVDVPELKRSVLNQTVQDLARNATLDSAGNDMGIIYGDAVLREAVSREPAFQDASGNFNQLQYQQVLYNNHLTERGFIRDYTSDLRQRTLLQPIVDNAAAPASIVDALLAYRGETRVADTLLVNANALPAPPAATEDALKQVYQQNIAAFTSPEYRKVSAVVLRAEDLVNPDNFSDEQLKAFYDENRDRYRTPATRDVVQLVFDTKAQAEAARALAAPGDHLADVAKKAKLGAPVDLGQLTKDAPLVKTMGAAYDLPVGEISQPVESDLGWHLFEVKDAKPEQVREFVSVRDEIRKALVADKGTDALYDASQKLEDDVAGGEPMDQVAEKLGGKLIAIPAMDRDGKDPRGLEAKGLIDNDRFIKTAFSLPSGSESKLMEIPKGYYMLRVESVTPPAAKPFEEVRKDVVALAEKESRLKEARSVAAKIAAEIKPDTPLAPIATAEKAPLEQIGPVNRFGQAPGKDMLVDIKRMSPELMEKLFAAKPGETVVAPVVDGVVVARLREVIPAGASEMAKQQTPLTNGLRQEIGNDLITAVAQTFAERYPVKTNDKALDTVLTTVR